MQAADVDDRIDTVQPLGTQSGALAEVKRRKAQRPLWLGKKLEREVERVGNPGKRLVARLRMKAVLQLGDQRLGDVRPLGELGLGQLAGVRASLSMSGLKR